MIRMFYNNNVVADFKYKKDLTTFLKQGLNCSEYWFDVSKKIKKFIDENNNLDINKWFNHVNSVVKLNNLSDDIKNDLFDLGYIYYIDYWAKGAAGCSDFFKDVLDNKKSINSFTFEENK